MDQPVLVGQRIKAVRRMTVKEQGEADLEPSRRGPVVLVLDSGVKVFALRGDLAVHDETPIVVTPTSVEVDG